MQPNLLIQICVLCVSLLAAATVRADWMNLTGAETAPNIAEIHVLDDHVKVNLEVYIGDLEKFEELVPDDWMNDSVDKRPSLEQRMQAFAMKRFQFVTDDGSRLPAKLELVEARERVNRLSPYAGMVNPITRQRVRGAPTDKRMLYAEIIYPFDDKPERLQIIPPLDDEGIATTNIRFVVYHKAVPIIDFRYLGQPATLNLNWQDPWYTRFDNKNLSRHHKYPLMLYLYVEPRQVRLESLLRIGDIVELTDFNAGSANESVKEKHQRLQKHIKDYYVSNDALEIDGDSFRPDAIRVEFLTATLSGLKVVEDSAAIDESSLLVGVSQRVFISSLPQKIESQWQYYNQRIDRIPVIVTDPVGPLPGYIDKDDPGFGWQNYLKKYSEPVIQPVTVETGWSVDIPYVGETQIINWMPDQQEALTIVADVLENVRIAFIEKDPNSFSKTLARIVNPENVDITTNELGKLFSPKVTGGAVGAIQVFNDVKISNMRELDDPDGFSATINGSAYIKAQHWGHVDQRRIEFQALLDLVEDNKQWKLADLTLIDIKEVK